MRAAGVKSAPPGQVRADLLLIQPDGIDQPATEPDRHTRLESGAMPLYQPGGELREQSQTQQQAITVECLTNAAAALQQARVARATTTTTATATVIPIPVTAVGTTATSSTTTPAPTTHSPDATEDHAADRTARTGFPGPPLLKEW